LIHDIPIKSLAQRMNKNFNIQDLVDQVDDMYIEAIGIGMTREEAKIEFKKKFNIDLVQKISKGEIPFQDFFLASDIKTSHFFHLLFTENIEISRYFCFYISN